MEITAPPRLSPRTAARVLAEARRSARCLVAFPGDLPLSLAQAYEIQREAIGLWSDRVEGWKVGRVLGDWADRLGTDRFVGPIFGKTVVRADSSERALVSAIDNGFAAVEAELIVRLRAAPMTPRHRKLAPIEDLIDGVFLGVEVAGSPLSTIQDDGPLVTIAAYGNNMGLILGPNVSDLSLARWGEIACSVTVDGKQVGIGTPDSIPGGPMTALRFALDEIARFDLPNQAATLISTGAMTGVHAVTIGQTCVVDFGGYGQLALDVEALAPT